MIATTMGALRPLLRRLPQAIPAVWLCKGFEADTDALGHEIARQERCAGGAAPSAVLSGPSFAAEVTRGADVGGRLAGKGGPDRRAAPPRAQADGCR